MGKLSRYVIGVFDKDMQYPELPKKHSNVDGDIIMQKLPKYGAVKAVWTNTLLKGRKQIIQESIYTFVATSLLC